MSPSVWNSRRSLTCVMALNQRVFRKYARARRMRWSASHNTFWRVTLETVREYRMPNVHLFIEAAHRAYGGELIGPHRHSPRPRGRDASFFSHSFRVKDARCRRSTRRSKKPLLVDQTDRPLRRSDLLSTLSQLKQWKVRMGESDWGELADISVIGARQCKQG
jgi:hypothetical protein